MTIWNLGSINSDHFYGVDHLPEPGETVLSETMERGLGGKGANMSVAAARAAAHVSHIGAVGPDGQWAVDRLTEYGVDTRPIAQLDTPTGHAVIALDAAGENHIIVFPGANREISRDAIGLALSEAAPGDILLMQNETNEQAYAAETGSKLGLKVAYAAAPFSAQAVRQVLPHLDILVLNHIEMAQLVEETGLLPGPKLGVDTVIVTKGAAGCVFYDRSNGFDAIGFDAIPVDAVDTTGAGDTFTGYFLAGIDRGMAPEEAIGTAIKASALMVTRRGTADVIPDLKEVLDWS
ncbi:ribokinase [Thalassovita aquimarina]|uniref:Ribokinase n=1 Tax=Thalassovita aquimarina TaxID=2785917 RepID=A0ABS5HNA8_9RHOB|nr:ribokinase [Thalassovita aquimarina]MBR9650435.1 ribokinase [Thalassovita aquimarina]